MADAGAVIVGVGLMTAVGVTGAETAASVRAATARFTESHFLDRAFQPITLAEVPADALPPLGEVSNAATLTSRERRLLRLASTPLRECLAPLSGRGVRVRVCVALPEAETTRAMDRASFLVNLGRQTEVALDLEGSDACHTGRAGGLVAVGQAVLTIESGGADFAVAGGVDTYRDLYVLGTLDRDRRVKSEANSDGLIPGEGAAFILLASPPAAAARGLPGIARVSRASVGFETGHLYSPDPYRGDGLATTLRQLVAEGAIEGPVAEVYSSMTGESHFAKEWGVAYLRNRATFQPSHDMHHPADCYGETGAASGPLMVGLAALGIRGGYRRSPALVYASSDRGARAAVTVSALPH